MSTSVRSRIHAWIANLRPSGPQSRPVRRSGYSGQGGQAEPAARQCCREPQARGRRGRDVPSRSTRLHDLSEGAVVQGIVKNLTDYGAFIDLGGIDGLLHVSDMSYGRITHPSEALQVGDEISVKVLKFDRDKERISLGMKQINPNPWDEIEDAICHRQRASSAVWSVSRTMALLSNSRPESKG